MASKKGWLIEGDKVVGYPEKKAYELSADPDHPNRNGQIWWTREAAEDALAGMLDPVGYAARRYEAGELDAQELAWLVGRVPAQEILNG